MTSVGCDMSTFTAGGTGNSFWQWNMGADSLLCACRTEGMKARGGKEHH
jgi:hypothetical protein